MRFPEITTQRLSVLLALLSVLIVFSGIRLSTVLSLYKTTFYPEPLANIQSYDSPEMFDFNSPINIPPEYYIEQTITLTSSSVDYNDVLKFKIKITNRGKIMPQEPRLVIFIIDSFYQHWASWNYTLSEDDFDRNLLLAYDLPSSDKKILGNWRIVSMVVDDRNIEIVSFTTIPFQVEESSFSIFNAILSALIGVILIVILAETINRLTRSRKSRKKAKKKIKITLDEFSITKK